MFRVIASVLLAACALVGAGCGSSASTQGPATHVVVTRDFGAAVLSPAEAVAATNGLTGLRQLETGHKVETGYGGRYVKSIDDTAEDSDNSWLFYVDGIESTVGATSTRLKPNQLVQWDFHPWQGVHTGGAIVGAYPQPFKAHGARLICAPRKSPTCVEAKRGMIDAGIVVSSTAKDRVVVGSWNNIQGLDGVPDLTEAGEGNGAYAQFSDDGKTLTAFQADGSPAPIQGNSTGLLAPFADASGVTWVATGTDEKSAASAARLLGADQSKLKNRFAILIDDGRERALPLGAGE
jgi:hypothetical protein